MKVAEKEELSNYKSLLIRRAFWVLSIKSSTLNLRLSVQATFPPNRDDKQTMLHSNVRNKITLFQNLPYLR